MNRNVDSGLRTRLNVVRWVFVLMMGLLLLGLVVRGHGYDSRASVAEGQMTTEEAYEILQRAGAMEPFFLDAVPDFAIDCSEDEQSLRNFVGGWGVVLEDGVVVLNEVRAVAFYDETGMPAKILQEPKNSYATILLNLDLPEVWRGRTITTIAPMDEGYPHYVGTAAPRVIPNGCSIQDYQDSGLWRWTDDGYVAVFIGEDHGETFSFKQATI